MANLPEDKLSIFLFLIATWNLQIFSRCNSVAFSKLFFHGQFLNFILGIISNA